MEQDVPRPTRTQLNGKDAPWPEGVHDLWQQRAANYDWEGRRLGSVNYHTPRPYRNDYDRGTDHWGFVYIIDGDKVCFIECVGDGWVRLLKAEGESNGC